MSATITASWSPASWWLRTASSSRDSSSRRFGSPVKLSYSAMRRARSSTSLRSYISATSRSLVHASSSWAARTRFSSSSRARASCASVALRSVTSSTIHTVSPASPPGVMFFTSSRAQKRAPSRRRVFHSIDGEPSAASASPIFVANDWNSSSDANTIDAGRPSRSACSHPNRRAAHGLHCMISPSQTTRMPTESLASRAWYSCNRRAMSRWLREARSSSEVWLMGVLVLARPGRVQARRDRRRGECGRTAPCRIAGLPASSRSYSRATGTGAVVTHRTRATRAALFPAPRTPKWPATAPFPRSPC